MKFNKILVKNGKGNKHRWIGINHRLVPALEGYIKNHRPKTNLSFVFVLPSGRRLTRDRVEKRMKYLFNKAGLDGLMHSFRRGCLTAYASRGVPISHLQLIAGHSSILTTQSYIRPDVQQVIKEQVNW